MILLLFSVALLFAGSQLSLGDVCQDTPPSAGLNCSTVTADMCSDTQLGPLLEERCPLTCGACTCSDLSPYCATHPELCTTSGFEQYVADNCQETCNFCGPNAATVATTSATKTTLPSVNSTTSRTPPCMDNYHNCNNFAHNGYCTDPLYKDMQDLCPKSCGLCH